MAEAPARIEAVQIDLDTVRHEGESVEGALAALALLRSLLPVSVWTEEDPMAVSEWLGKQGFSCWVDLGNAEHRDEWPGEGPLSAARRGFILVTNQRIRGVFIAAPWRAVSFVNWIQALSELGSIAGPDFQRRALEAVTKT
jgi:hypothetical protein